MRYNPRTTPPKVFPRDPKSDWIRRDTEEPQVKRDGDTPQTENPYREEQSIPAPKETW